MIPPADTPADVVREVSLDAYYRREIAALQREVSRLRRFLAGDLPEVAPGDWCVVVHRGGYFAEIPAKLIRYAPEYPNGGPWSVTMYDATMMDDEFGPYQTLAKEIRCATPDEIAEFERLFA